LSKAFTLWVYHQKSVNNHIGVPHLEISPKNIWIEDQFLVYLRPFKLKFESTNLLYTKKMKNSKNSQSIADSRSWYMAPEQTIKDFKQINYAEPDSDDSFSSEKEKGFSDIASDMWALGCVFAEMFVSLTPVFQSVDTFDRIIRFFEVLGIPKKEDVFYMSQELYETILEHLNSRIYKDNEFPLIGELTRSLSKSEAKVLTSLLLFNPNKRPRCEILIQFPFFKSYTPERHRNSIDYIAQNDIEENLPSNKQSAIKNSISRTPNESMKEPSTVYQMDNSHDTSIRNTSNWWNIDPIITPKDPFLGQKEQTHYHNRSEVISLNNQRSGTKQKDQNMSYNVGRMSAKPDLNTERTKTPVQKRNDSSISQNESQILRSNYRSQPTKDSTTHLRIDSNFPSIPIPSKGERASTTTNQTAKTSARLESTRVLPEEKQNEYRSEKVVERLNSTRSTHRGDSGAERENRGSTVNVSQRKDSIKPSPKARFSINIEILKNLA
jgi:Protein kinase domain